MSKFNGGKRTAYRVLIAVRDEVFGKAMIDFVANHHWPERTQFHVVSVIEPNTLKNPLLLPQEVIDDITRDEQQSAQKLLDYMARRIYAEVPGARVCRHKPEGDPKRVLLKTAAGLNANMLVLGSHERSGFERILLGSVANAVVTHATCSTVVVRLSRAECLENNKGLDFSLDDLPDRMKEEIGLCIE